MFAKIIVFDLLPLKAHVKMTPHGPSSELEHVRSKVVAGDARMNIKMINVVAVIDGHLIGTSFKMIMALDAKTVSTLCYGC